jgi:hypothetical protein
MSIPENRFHEFYYRGFAQNSQYQDFFGTNFGKSLDYFGIGAKKVGMDRYLTSYIHKDLNRCFVPALFVVVYL